MADSVVLKISFEDQMRRTQLVQPLTIAQVREQISRLFPNVKYFTLSYLDEEGDKITVSSDIELQEAHRVCHPNIRLTLEKLDQPTNSSFTALPGGSLLDHVSPSLNSSPPPAAAAPPSAGSLFPSNPVGSLLNYLSPSASDEDEELQKQLEAIYLQEKQEKEAKEKAEREEHERQERERREREEQRERERLAKEKAEREERERLERERIEREREERERQELERKEREVRELLEKLEQEKQREEQLRLEKEKKILEQNSKEHDRERILQSNESCGEILERLLSEGVELELAWQALEFSNYSNEKRARDLLKMNELGLDFRKASDALTKFNGDFVSAVDSLME